MSSDSVKDISFKESFRRARTAGLDTFTHNGKKYTTELASSKAAAPTPKAKAESKPTPKAEAPKAEAPKADNEIPSPGRYKQDTYETPLKSAARKYGSEVKDNLGKIAAGLGVTGGVVYGGSKLIDAARAADKARNTATLARGNAGLAERMKGVVGTAEKEAASQAAKRDMFKTSQERLKSESGKAAEERLTGLAMNPRRKNIALTEAEKAAEKEVGLRRGGGVKKMAKGGSVSSRADGCAQRGKTNCRMV